MVLTSKTQEEFKKYLGDDLMENEAKELLEEEQDKYTSDDEVVALYSAYTKEELERNTILEEETEEARKKGLEQGLEQGLQQGIEQGLKQGIQNEKINIAKNMIKESIDINIISKVIGLSKEEIEEL